MKPLLKWVGGKTQILDEVLTTFPDYSGTYREPFVGGGSVLLCMLERRATRVVASDLNPHLIHFYQTVQSDDTPLVRSALSGCLFSTVSVRRAIHSKNPGARTTELLCKST